MSADTESEIREVVRAVHDFAIDNGLPRIDRPITIFIYQDLDSLASEFEATTGRGFEGSFWPDFKAGNSGTQYSNDFVAINPLASRFQEHSPYERRRELAGALFKVYRLTLTRIWEGTPRDAVSREGPTWLTEGASEYLASLAIGPRGSESCDLTRSWNLRAIFRGPADTPLSEMETVEAFYSQTAGRNYGFLGMELLAEQTGIESIFAYFASLRTGITWQEAFRTAFGMTIQEFYRLFEEHRAVGFPEPGLPRSGDGPAIAPGPFSELFRETDLPSYLRWDIGRGVERAEVESAFWGAELMHEFARLSGIPDPSAPITITIYKDMEEMACRYSRKTGWDLDLSRKYWENGGAVAGRESVHISASTPERRKSDPHRLLRTMTHELTHAWFQNGLVGFSERRSGMSPRWLGEGTAQLVTALLLREDHPDVFYQGERPRAELASRALATGVTLQDSEVWPPSEGGTIGMDDAGLNIVSCIYSCGYFAAELLASQVGVGKLFDYYKHVEAWMEPWDPVGGKVPTRDWMVAFERAYGMTVEEFYELFEEHRAAGFPEVEVPESP